MYSVKGLEIQRLDVIATDIPLNERFQKIPSHNPLRPNVAVKRSINIAGDDEDDVTVSFTPRKPFRDMDFLAELPSRKASKDLEIMRLKAQLRSAQLRLSAANARKAVMSGLNHGALKNRRKPLILNRIGGGVIAKPPRGNGLGEGLVLRDPRTAMKFLVGAGAGKHGRVNKARQFGISPLKLSEGADLNFFGPPKNKDELDKELDMYMSQSKNKLKTDLDKELEEYMSARARLTVGKPDPPPVQIPVNATATRSGTPVPDVIVDDLEDIMELAD